MWFLEAIRLSINKFKSLLPLLTSLLDDLLNFIQLSLKRILEIVSLQSVYLFSMMFALFFVLVCFGLVPIGRTILTVGTWEKIRDLNFNDTTIQMYSLK